MDASAFAYGNVLSIVAGIYLDSITSIVKRRLKIPMLTVGTMCSVGEVFHCVQEARREQTALRNNNFASRTLFTCDIVETKRDWEMELNPDDDCCCFVDAAHLAGTKAYCCRHNDNCPVPGCNLLTVGTSCKDFSKANANRGNSSQALTDKTSPGKSADTLQALWSYLDSHGPDVVILENSDTVGEEPQKAELVLSDFASRGYDAQPFLLDAQTYRMPQHRCRTYILAAKTISSFLDITKYDSFFKKVAYLLKEFQGVPPPLADVLLDPDSELLADDLQSRLANKPKAQATRGPQTAAIHSLAFHTQGVRWGVHKSTVSTTPNAWYDLLPVRAKECIVLAERTGEDHGGLDVGQSIYRLSKTISVDGVGTIAPTVMPEQWLWLFWRQRWMTSYEALAIQGFPVHAHETMLKKYGAKMRYDIAGNMFAGTVVLAVFAAFLGSATFAEGKGRAKGTDKKDVVQAMALMKSMKRSLLDFGFGLSIFLI